MKPKPGARSTFRHPMPAAPFADDERMLDLLKRFWRLNRLPVTPETDQLAAHLAQSLNGTVIEAGSGETCLTWTIPHRWRVRKGQLRRLDGGVVADYADHPLHLWAHSVSFSGVIDRETLLADHVNTDPDRPDEWPWHYRNSYRPQAREWGFSLPYRLVQTMTDAGYQVEIDADLDHDGTLKVVDAFLPGEHPETLFVMAHTCHPALVSDGLGSIAAAVELYHYLKRRPRRRYSYRFLFGPEYYAAAAWLDRAPRQAVESLHAGIFLDMMTTHEPLGFQRSMAGDSRLDRAARNVFRSHLSMGFERPYGELWGNDEKFYAAPGYRLPVLGIGRAMHREYHYNTDDLDHYDPYHALEGVWVLQRLMEVLESDFIPRLQFTGALYLSRYDLYQDPNVGADLNTHLERMHVMADGRNSCLDIADHFNVDFFAVRRHFEDLIRHRLAEALDRPPRGEDQGGAPWGTAP
ncbi:MAG: DUF4910 domain-containing protein [Magnetococcales bacterium]|nr:DUF4910 domain-containing protein [Magnetococcales bacterium]